MDHNPVTFEVKIPPALRPGREAVTSIPPGLAAAITRIAANLAASGRLWMQRVTDALAAIDRVRDTIANDPVTVAGLEGRYQVRAGLDPAYADPEALTRLVILIMNGIEGGTATLSPASRAMVAAAAMRGWAQSYPDAVEVLAWHRLLGDVAVVVTRG